MENFQTEFEYWQNEVRKAVDDWMEETENYHKYVMQFFETSTNGKVDHEATKVFNREEFIKINEMRDGVEKKKKRLDDLSKIWLSLRRK